MQRSRKKIEKILAVLAAVIVAVAMAPSVFAVNAQGSILLRCISEQNGMQVSLAGDTFALVKLADALVRESDGQVEVELQTLQQFSSFDCDWDTLKTSDRIKKAEAIAAFVRSTPESSDVSETDENGVAQFQNVEPGLYLIFRTKIINDQFEEEPILVCVPQIVNDEVNYSVIIEPKIRWKSKTQQSSNEDDCEKCDDKEDDEGSYKIKKSKKKSSGGSSGGGESGSGRQTSRVHLPNTGDGGLIAVSSVGFLLVGLGIWIRRRAKHKD